MEILGDALEGYIVTKGTIHFEKEKAPPKSFLKAVVTARIQAINAGYPKKSGEFLELYGNGVPKARGKYKGDQMHGAWSFFRKDGTLMRSGSFREGKQTGEWITYDTSGSPYKTTRMG
jgi:antitoxin component YwqK of YwqJK toxin-antitoxin module